MPKRFLLFIILITTDTIVTAQTRAVGVRMSYGLGYSQQYNIKQKTMIQADLDLLGNFWGVQGTVTYNRLFHIADWSKCKFGAFLGIGAGGGLSLQADYPYNVEDPSEGMGRLWFIGAAVNGGFEFNFKSGLQLSIDWRPVIAPCFLKNGGADFFVEGLFIGACAVAVRYKFKR